MGLTGCLDRLKAKWKGNGAKAAYLPSQSEKAPVAHQTVVKWVEAYHAASGTLNMAHWLDSMFTSTPAVKFFSFPLISGREALLPMFENFTSQLDALDHKLILTEYVAPHIFHRCTVRYDIKGESQPVIGDVFVLFTVKQVKLDGKPWFECEKMECFGDPSELLSKVKLG